METPTELPFAPVRSKADASELDPLRRYIQIGQDDTYWMELTYFAALHTITLEKLASKSSATSSPKHLIRSLRGMKTEAQAEATLMAALARVVRVEKAMTLAEVTAKGGSVVANFPAPEEDPKLDNRIGST